MIWFMYQTDAILTTILRADKIRPGQGLLSRSLEPLGYNMRDVDDNSIHPHSVVVDLSAASTQKVFLNMCGMHWVSRMSQLDQSGMEMVQMTSCVMSRQLTI